MATSPDVERHTTSSGSGADAQHPGPGPGPGPGERAPPAPDVAHARNTELMARWLGSPLPKAADRNAADRESARIEHVAILAEM